MDIGSVLNKSMFRFLRDAAATIRAVSFFLAPIFAGAGVLVYLLTTYVVSRTALAVIAVVSVFMIGVLTLSFWYYVTHVCDPAPYEITKLDCLLITERLAGHHRYVNRREQTVKARRNNVRLIEHRSHWTGKGSKGKLKAGSLVDRHEFYLARHPEEDGRTQQWIYLGRPLGKGDEVRIGFHQTFEDNLDPMHTYYREGGGRYRTSNLTVTARFAADHDPPTVEGFVWNNDRKNRQRHEVGRIAVERRSNPTTRTVDYVVYVRKARPYHSYGVRWEW